VTVFVSGQVKNSPRLGKYVADVRSFPADAVLSYRLAGMRGIWNALAERTIHRVLRTGHVMVFAQQLESAPEVLAPAGVIIRALRDNDWPALSRIATQRSLASFRLLAATGRHCLVAWRGAEAIGYGWVAERIGTDVTACPVAMPPDAAYFWDLYVVPAERSNGVGSALASARVQLARRLGFREGWRMIAPENAASLRTLAKTGTHTRTVGELRFIKIFASVHGRLRPVAFPDRVT
jgi:GNAT superfamily N-acetyltransferase